MQYKYFDFAMQHAFRARTGTIKDFGAFKRAASSKRRRQAQGVCWGDAKGIPGPWAAGPGCVGAPAASKRSQKSRRWRSLSDLARGLGAVDVCCAHA
jgi:hypothetical protein